MAHTALTWQVVDETAAALGAGESARLKWRQEGRGVPPAWRIRIAEKLGDVALSDFEALPSKPGRVTTTSQTVSV